MNTEVRSINVPEGYQRHETSDRPLILAQVDHRPAGSPAKNATCHYCQKRGNLERYVCQSRRRKMCMKSKRPVPAEVNQYLTLASHRVITCFRTQLVQHP